jgi:hypothetical protein
MQANALVYRLEAIEDGQRLDPAMAIDLPHHTTRMKCKTRGGAIGNSETVIHLV